MTKVSENHEGNNANGWGMVSCLFDKLQNLHTMRKRKNTRAMGKYGLTYIGNLVELQKHCIATINSSNIEKYSAKEVLEIVLDRINHYIEGWEKIGTSDRQLTMPIVMQQSELLKFAKWEKGKNLTETYEWEGAAGILREYLREQEITIE